MSNVLEISNLNKCFGDFSLKNVNFSLPEGYIMGFIGPNGAGKTTTIKLILNMIKRQSGDIKVFGLDSITHEDNIKEQVGVVFDQPYFVDEWNLNDVEKAVKFFYKKWSSNKFVGYLKEFNLERKKKVKDLSRGMKMKLMIAVALSHDARFLILDEPTSGLDPVARDELMDILSEFVINDTRSVLFSTHITSDLDKVADYITFINNGEIVFTGTKDLLLESYCIVKGGKGDINPEQKKMIMGLREHGAGFEGLIGADKSGMMGNKVLIETCTMDDIIVFMNKGRALV
ncbi:ABC transporter ATP-binding protein [Pseudobacteroides cellulosolvens]|uniref:ABC transporter related protein n=1 Tax=Pseudobacteroides cellulosolvens ATCC 35603 = DSM 2933 TaxID=398512 RepID=A0A0L6JVF1_9FIRM|nr:ABC transporter ATP-binding protein [Pseudobacteroides cellulosolvens]KNY29803.1 ABC transporter related protein [Pseudobacteroides cellulosolvens ATCC 35603 = DSM 2933]